MTARPQTPKWHARIGIGLLCLLPKHLLTAAFYWLARVEWEPLKRLLIRWVVARYRIDMSEAEDPHQEHYPHLNSLFTRPLRPSTRPIAGEEDCIVSPVDGLISQIGTIEGGRLIQAKGHSFGLRALLAGDLESSRRFNDGHFATLYLSPRNYHRVHMPLRGRLTRMQFVPGELHSVGEASTRLIPELFARNERLITLFDTPGGDMALILVGAFLVNSIETVWAGELREHGQLPLLWNYPAGAGPLLHKGAEMGRFNMGSTVILLFPKGHAEWDSNLGPGSHIRFGSRLGRLHEGQTPVA